ncbi:hypothetical protein GCM10009566_59680 [Streptomyces murinus]
MGPSTLRKGTARPLVMGDVFTVSGVDMTVPILFRARLFDGRLRARADRGASTTDHGIGKAPAELAIRRLARKRKVLGKDFDKGS